MTRWTIIAGLFVAVLAGVCLPACSDDDSGGSGNQTGTGGGSSGGFDDNNSGCHASCASDMATDCENKPDSLDECVTACLDTLTSLNSNTEGKCAKPETEFNRCYAKQTLVCSEYGFPTLDDKACDKESDAVEDCIQPYLPEQSCASYCDRYTRAGCDDKLCKSACRFLTYTAVFYTDCVASIRSFLDNCAASAEASCFDPVFETVPFPYSPSCKKSAESAFACLTWLTSLTE